MDIQCYKIILYTNRIDKILVVVSSGLAMSRKRLNQIKQYH